MVSHTRLKLATNEETHVLMLPTSPSLQWNSTSRYVIDDSDCLSAIFLTIDVFLFLVSVKAGSTAIEFKAASA